MLVNSLLIMVMKEKDLHLSSSIMTVFYLYKLPFNYMYIFILSFCLYFLSFIPSRMIWRFISHAKVMMNVTTKDGYVHANKYLLNPDINNSLLLGASDNDFDPKKILIPKESISHIEFFTIYFEFEKEYKREVQTDFIILPK